MVLNLIGDWLVLFFAFYFIAFDRILVSPLALLYFFLGATFIKIVLDFIPLNFQSQCSTLLCTFGVLVDLLLPYCVQLICKLTS